MSDLASQDDLRISDKDLQRMEKHAIAAEVRNLATEALRLREALRRLVDRLEFVKNDERYMAVWILFSTHGGRYDGPTYTAELDNARSILSNIPGASKTDKAEMKNDAHD